MAPMAEVSIFPIYHHYVLLDPIRYFVTMGATWYRPVRQLGWSSGVAELLVVADDPSAGDAAHVSWLNWARE